MVGRRVHPLQILVVSYRPDDRGAVPVRQLRGELPDAAEHTLRENGRAGYRAIAEDRPVGAPFGRIVVKAR